MIDIEVDGLDELHRALGALPARISKRVLGNASRAAGRVIRKRAASNAPVQSGNLRKSIQVRGLMLKRGGYLARVGIRDKGKGTAFYGLFHERGTKPHIISARAGSALSFDGRFYKSVRHPGARAQEWMHRAAKEGATGSIEKFRQIMLSGLERETRKLGSVGGGR